MPAIHEPMCRVGAAVELHRQHRPLFATYVKGKKGRAFDFSTKDLPQLSLALFFYIQKK